MSVLVRSEREDDAAIERFLESFQTVAEALAEREGIGGDYLIDLMAVSPSEIRAVNRDTRGIDHVTDVLSFPASVYRRGTARDCPAAARSAFDPDTGRWFLGDIVVCPKRAARQAEAFGHSFDREICYLFAHGACHLLGYDHNNNKNKTAMREAEEYAMNALGLAR